ncbi:Spo12 family protein [Aspergillus mulundensis]|uniref:Putative Spo12 family protein n=1 Tax=Aspergillus mulundensis TaxID=1810919 RepID=A0A3D8RXK9_9EURO|nr:putative Spo12 family protein [Aspergillus mulundensis]RDW78765.1 putative Spo12 family protein [Aspergillus mulundensis]
MNSTPLAARSPNTHLAVSNEQDLKAASTMDPMDQHRQKLQGKIENQDSQQASYVSPSDDIMSPCSKKLSDLKGKRFKNAGKPQSLFAKLGKKNFEQQSSAAAAENTEKSV